MNLAVKLFFVASILFGASSTVLFEDDYSGYGTSNAFVDMASSSNPMTGTSGDYTYNSGGVNVYAYLKGLSDHVQLKSDTQQGHSMQVGYTLIPDVSTSLGGGAIILNVTYKLDTLPSGVLFTVGLSDCEVYVYNGLSYVFWYSQGAMDYLTPVTGSWVTLKMTVASDASSITVQQGSDLVVLYQTSPDPVTGTVNSVISLNHQNLAADYSYYLQHMKLEKL